MHTKRAASGLRLMKSEQNRAVHTGDEDNDNDIKSLATKQRDIFTRVYNIEEEEELQNIYSDQTGHFPKRSSKGKQYIMVLVHINSGAILVTAMKDQTSGEMIRAYQSLIDRLKAHGIRLKHHVLDNKCSDDFKAIIKKNQMTYQLVPPHDH
jgi:hypothetical protein